MGNLRIARADEIKHNLKSSIVENSNKENISKDVSNGKLSSSSAVQLGSDKKSGSDVKAIPGVEDMSWDENSSEGVDLDNDADYFDLRAEKPPAKRKPKDRGNNNFPFPFVYVAALFGILYYHPINSFWDVIDIVRTVIQKWIELTIFYTKKIFF